LGLTDGALRMLVLLYFHTCGPALPRFRDVMTAQGKPLPLHGQLEFVDYLKYGLLELGFLSIMWSYSRTRNEGWLKYIRQMITP